MKATFSLLSLIVLLLFITSCKSPTVGGDELKTFDLTTLPDVKTVKLSELGFKNIEYIPLETNEKCMISGTDDFLMPVQIIVGETFYLLKHFNTILKFQNNGSFVTQIGTKGRGPNEFTVAHDVKIDEKNQNIYLLSRWQKNFFIYSDDGEFIKTIQFTISPDQFIFFDNLIFCYSGNHMGNIDNSYDLIDFNGRIIKSYVNKYPFSFYDGYHISNENIFYRFNNCLYKKEVYSDTIYIYQNEEFKPHLVIHVGDRLITTKARSEHDGLYLGMNYIRPLRLFEFGEFVYYEFIYSIEIPDKVSLYTFIGSKENNFMVFFDAGQGIINDLDGGPNIFPRTVQDDNSIIAIVDALKLKTHVASEAFKNSVPKNPEKKETLEKLASNLNESDNPVLMIVKLRE
jgi:hypothetical protein